MSTFEEYSNYYDLLYQDKNYNEEVDYVDGLIKRNKPNAKTLLDLGCGTGRHNALFEKKGYKTTGVDISHEMIKKAKSTYPLDFMQSDIRSLQLEKKYDVIVSLFHVMSYQTTNEDLTGVFNSAKKHLNPNGLFVFDCWYGPAILNDQPVTRIKRMEDDKIDVTRLSESVLHANTNVVDVTFEVFIKNKMTSDVKKIKELHSMRYLFYPEILKYAKLEGFEVKVFEEWLTGKKPDLNSRNVVFVCSLVNN
ncbi:MAG TPA: class I SAM-dependent methyltransferase [Bacteroidia bacterium]|jgi:SAM-dependent methyltransferase|nr:class I SAM-dependent methyltransferase [Bacteroidia bacterium]